MEVVENRSPSRRGSMMRLIDQDQVDVLQGNRSSSGIRVTEDVRSSNNDVGCVRDLVPVVSRANAMFKADHTRTVDHRRVKCARAPECDKAPELFDNLITNQDAW